MKSNGRLVFGVSALITISGVVACSSDDGQPSNGTSSGGTSDGGASEGGGTAKKKLAEACTKPEDCESGECFVGGQGSWCSLKCTDANAATVCVSPLTHTCNKQGYCKKD